MNGDRRLRGLAPSVLAIVVSMELFAATPAAAEIEEVVVTARKREEALQDVPVAAYALTAKDIERNSVTDLTAVGKLTPGLILSKGVNGAAANIFLRGIGSSVINTAFDQAVLINVDNVPISKGRAAFDAYMDMEQAEVLRGPQALYFGKNASAGIISIKTKDPGEHFEALARTGYNLYGEGPYAEGVISSPISDTLGVRLAVRASELTEGYFKNIAEDIDGIHVARHVPQEKEVAGRLTVVFKPSEQFDAKLRVSATKFESNDINSFAQKVDCQGPGGAPQPIFVDLAGAVPGFPGWPSKGEDGCRFDKTKAISALHPAVAARYPQSRGGQPFRDYTSALGSLTLNYHLEKATITLVTGWYQFDTTHFGNFDLGTANVIFGDESDDYHSFTQELRIATDLDGPLNFTGGLFYEKSRLHMTRSTKLFGSTLDPSFNPNDPFAFVWTAPDPVTGWSHDWDQAGRTNGQTWSAFLEARWNITPTVELAGGARFTREIKKSTFEMLFVNRNFLFGPAFPAAPIHNRFADNNISPAATLTWRPTGDLTFFTAYRTGFKSGGANLSDTFARASTIGYGSETAKGGELGAKMLLLDHHLRLNATLYRYAFEDLQVTIFDPVTTSLPVGNAGKLHTTGLELDALYQPPGVPGLALRGSVAYNEAEFAEFIGPCYTGQTIAEGCNQNMVGGVGFGQDMAGRPRSQAPRWTSVIGGTYEFPGFSDAVRMSISTDARYTSDYYLNETLSPTQRNGKGYWNLDASIRLYDPEEKWEVALIGRNLLDELVGINSLDVPGTGSGAGTSSGVRADTWIMATNVPREVAIQFTYRF